MISTLDSRKIRRYVLLCLGLLCILTAILLPTAWYDQIPKSRANLPSPPIKGVTLVRLCFGLEGFLLLIFALKARVRLEIRDEECLRLPAPLTGPSLDAMARAAIAEPVVVNEAFVRRFFPTEDPIGKRFCIDPTNKTYWYQIVGVVGDMHRQGLEHAAIPEYFGPLISSDNGRVDLLVRARQDPTPQAPTIRRLVLAGIPGVIVPSVSTAERQLGEFSAERSFQTWLLAGFATIALSLAMIGVYGVLHYAIAERRREIGVRIALGASPATVVAMAMRQGMRSPLIGVALGVAGALALSRMLDHLLFETGSTDLVTYAGVVLLLGLSAAIACYLPARRAATIDPIVTLKQD